jgi:uncharacterized damage-inducible protein DinB
MITPDYVRTMASYNRWQNQNLYGAADGLSDAARREQRGAFFGSIHGTLSHLMWGDQMWMSRFAGTPPPRGGIPGSVDLYTSWQDLNESARLSTRSSSVGPRRSTRRGSRAISAGTREPSTAT